MRAWYSQLLIRTTNSSSKGESSDVTRTRSRAWNGWRKEVELRLIRACTFNVSSQYPNANSSCRFTLGNKTGRIRDLLKKSGTLYVSQPTSLPSMTNLPFSSKSRTFMGPDGLTYKWKYVVAGSNPTFPEGSHWTLYGPNTEHPIATTQRLVERDNSVRLLFLFFSVGADPDIELFD